MELEFGFRFASALYFPFRLLRGMCTLPRAGYRTSSESRATLAVGERSFNNCFGEIEAKEKSENETEEDRAEDRQAAQPRPLQVSLELPGELTAPVTRSRGLFLLVTTKCDIACTYCFYTTGHEARDPNVFDLDQADVLAERLAALRFGTVILTGGDPLSTKDKHRTILLTRQLADSGVRVIINTSGVFLDEADCRQLVEAGPARIDFSIDSCDKHTHNRQRGRFTDTVNAIQTLRDLGFDDIVTTTVVTKRNRHQIEDTWEFLNELGATESRFQPAFLPVVNPGLGLRMDDEVRKQLEAIATKPRAAIHLGKYFRLWEKYHGDPDLAPSDSERRCSMGKDMFVSDSLGNLTGCFHREDVKLGNLLSDDVSGLDKAMTSNPLVQYELPPCAGPHCTSLFDDPTNWKS